MYEQSFGLTGRPFMSTPYVPHYFPSESVHHALNQVKVCIDRGAGPALIVGVAGTGKSMLLALLNQQYQKQFKTACLYGSNLADRNDLLQHLMFELGLPYRDVGENEMRLTLREFLRDESVSKQGVLVLIDEAHKLPKSVLEELTSSLNFVRKGRPLINLVLAGLPSLEENLIESRTEALNQRIASRSYLSNLTESETMDYIFTHVERVGGHGEHLFTGEAVKAVHQFSDGCPRIVNLICDYALVLAATQNATRISADLIQSAWCDVQSIPAPIPSQAKIDDSLNVPSENENAAEEGGFIIEFGQLDDGADTQSIPVEAVQVNKHEPSISEQPTHDEVEAAPISVETDGFADPVEWKQLELEVESIRNEIHVDEPSALVNEDNLENTSGVTVTEPKEEIGNFEDPFHENFETEESVDLSYVPVVSEQNLNALMLTPKHLQILDQFAETETDSDPKIALVISETQNQSTEVDPVDETAEQRQQLLDVDAVEESSANTEPIGSDSLSFRSSSAVENDIKKIQRDWRFSEENFRSVAVHPSFETSHSIPVVTAATLDDSTVLPKVVTDDGSTETVVDPKTQCRETEQVEDSRCDDRDMMIISQTEVFQPTHSEKEIELAPQSQVSTGTAHRVEYTELFRQLRNA